MAQDTSVPASVVLQRLHDQVPDSAVTLQWVMGRLNEQSFGMIMLILGIVAAAPGVSVLAGLLLLIAAFQMMLGHAELTFPKWLATRELPTRPIDAVVRRAMPILVYLERAFHPRFATPPELTKRAIGTVIFVLAVRLLTAPFPLSNILPAVLIAAISLAYLERDGLLLAVALLAACLFLVIESVAIWQLLHQSQWLRRFG